MVLSHRRTPLDLAQRHQPLAACDEGGEQGGKVYFAHFLKPVQNLCNLLEFDYQIMEIRVWGTRISFGNKDKYGTANSTQI